MRLRALVRGPPKLLRYRSGGDPRTPLGGRSPGGLAGPSGGLAVTSERPVAAPRFSPPTSPRRSDAVTEPSRGVSFVNTPGVRVEDVVVEDVVGEVEEKEVGDKGEEEGGVVIKQVEEVTGEEKSVEQEGGDSGRRGGEAAEGRMVWSEQVEEEEMEEESIKEKKTVKRIQRPRGGQGSGLAVTSQCGVLLAARRKKYLHTSRA
ncbi:unnamed protein product, partial [Pleuronectes platessa]